MFDFPNSPAVGQTYSPVGGPSWTWDGTAWKTYQTQGEMQIARTFIPGSSSGATVYVYNKPANLRHMEFEGVAAGGSAGPAIATAASTWSGSTSGGGGAWGRKLFTAAALPSSVTITIGAPGQGVSSGNGLPAASTTFGSLITLPGGNGGIQLSNTLYSSYNVGAGASMTAYPTGVDVGLPGEGSDGCALSYSMGYPTVAGLVSSIGRAGSSPWGRGYQSIVSTANNSTAGVGYGWGSGGPLNAASSALRASVAGGPGAVLLTEYLVLPATGSGAPIDGGEYVMVNGAWRLKEQSFDLSGLTTKDIPVPAGAKRVILSGHFGQATTTSTGMLLRVSMDGSTFLAGASDYYTMGPFHNTGSSGYANSTPGAVSYFTMTLFSDANTTLPHDFTTELQLARGTSAGYLFAKHYGKSYNSAAASNYRTWWGWEYINSATMGSALDIKALRLLTGNAVACTAGSYVNVRWMY